MCSLNGQLGCKKTWQLLRSLLDPANTKSAARKKLTQLIHQYPGTDEELLAELASRYINTSRQSDAHMPHHLPMNSWMLIFRRQRFTLRCTSCARHSGTSTKALLSLDVHEAFDHVIHAAVLESLAYLQPGERTCNYIRSFLTDRMIEIAVGDLRLPVIRLGDRGTPQGAPLSPFLFHLAMRTLPPKLNEVPGLRHTLYADDITLWTCEGSDGTAEMLQHATDIVLQHVNAARLECSQHKSELLMRPPNRSQHKSHPPPIALSVNRQPVTHVEHMRVLSMTL
ncbi:uncharacterized protein [Dermacentor andersoni]|uniref:uncharacterized protein n=1 Tax=Dermacentor andersoni TaxID=34620 RepID=UPI0021559524|nr:uncharacterized protein LOC126528524 [Dermacentor andersoni]